MQPFDNLLIDSTNILSLLLSFYNLTVFILKQSKFNTFFTKVPSLSYFSYDIEFKSIVPWSFIFDISIIDW